MRNEIKLGNVMVDCDNELKLQRFYGELLGWEMCNLFNRSAVRSSEGIVFLFIEELDYVKPVWPEEMGKQQKQMHFNFQAEDVNVAVEKAISLGAIKVLNQYGGKHFTTIFDPASHPFCLCKK